MKLEHGTPREIEGESMRIIGRELEAMGIVLPAGCEAVVKRAIHTTADFDYARNLRFTPGAVEAGVAALRAGTALVTDTNMALSGVNRGACEQLGVERFCYMADPQVAERARAERTTRAAAAVDCWASEHPAGIFAVGNAPTALLRLAECMEAGTLRPALVIGAPWALSMWWRARSGFGPCARTWMSRPLWLWAARGAPQWRRRCATRCCIRLRACDRKNQRLSLQAMQAQALSFLL